MVTTLKVKKQNSILQPASDLNRVTIRSDFGAGKNLTTLNDVTVVSQTAGAVPIYDTTLAEFEIRPLEAADLNVDTINGGTY